MVFNLFIYLKQEKFLHIHHPYSQREKKKETSINFKSEKQEKLFLP